MASTDARPIPRKNTAFRVTFPIFDADGDLVTGASSLDSEVSIDGGSFADCTNEATEIGSTGFYYLDLTAAEMNGDTVAVQVKTATSGAKTTPLVFYPEEAGDVRVDVVQISGDATAADNLEAAADGNGYNLGGGSVVAASVTGNVGGNVVGSVASVAGAVGSVTGNVGGNVTGSVGSVAGNVGGNVVGSVNSVATGVTLADDAITASKFDESTAFPQTAAYTVPLNAAGTRAALGLASANLDTQLADLPTVAEFEARTLAAASYFDPSVDKVIPIDVDGITFASAVELMLAVLAGVAVPSGSTVAFKKRDGTTTKITITYGSADGERTASVIS